MSSARLSYITLKFLAKIEKEKQQQKNSNEQIFYSVHWIITSLQLHISKAIYLIIGSNSNKISTELTLSAPKTQLPKWLHLQTV